MGWMQRTSDRSARRRRVARVARPLGYFFFVLGGTLLAGSFYGAAWRIAPRAEAPLTSLCSFAMDGRGRIYCGTGLYQRVQVYEADGTYVGGWFVDAASGGSFLLAVSAEGNIQVVTSNGRYLEEYSPEGEFISRRKLGILEYEEFPRSKKIALPDRAGCFLVLDTSVFSPGVKRRCASGEVRWVVRNPLRLWPLSAPFPALAYVFISIVLFRIAGVKLSRWERSLPGLD